ncbi:unnamed protein product [Microthlaspi erraticum]|uniref:F-box domain-containing protein n=1 Tax=Microthlaspi erraticum TaxID=1685480 RepID=A0A6D2JMP2_9BRAS|nr:unnamed protein product [Microthlaspi erraticum]
MTSKEMEMEMVADSNEKACNDSKQPILSTDLIRPILERLSFVDFHRARCVSSGWYIASKSCIGVTNPTTPWIILFTKEEQLENNNVSCKLFDPRDHTCYTVRDLGIDFARSCCLASSGSWFLMLLHRTDFYLFNLFTRQKIPLPSMGSIDDFDATSSSGESSDVRLIGSAVLGVDEESRDYFVVWSYNSIFAYHKRGDNNERWKVLKPLKGQGCIDMVFKQGKLYVLTVTRSVTVFDFLGGDSPTECEITPPPLWCSQDLLNNIAVTLSGEVLLIASFVKKKGKCFFDLFRRDPKRKHAWKFIDSVGEEALLLDQGIAVAAKDGVMRDCIYFTSDRFCRDSGIRLSISDYIICVSHVKKNRVVQRFDHLTASSPINFKDARWFSPTFGGKWLH